MRRFLAAGFPGISRVPARTALLLTSLVVVLVTPVAAQDPGQRAPPETAVGAPGRTTFFGIEGRVVAENEGANLGGVHVVLTDFRGGIRATYDTRSGGGFFFSNLASGRYTLTFLHPDFADQRQTIDLIFSSQVGMVVTLFRNRARAAPSSAQGTVPSWALQIPPQAQKEFLQGVEALDHGDATTGVGHLRSAIQAYPRFASAYSALGAAHTSAGDIKAAEVAYEKALEIDETLSTAHLGLGNLFLGEKRYQDAEKHLDRADALKPDDWRVQYGLGDLYWRVGEWAKAEEKFRRSIELHGKLPRMHLLMINVLAGQEKFPEALAAMESFLKRFPEDRFAPEVRQKRDLLKAHIEKTSVAQPAKKP